MSDKYYGNICYMNCKIFGLHSQKYVNFKQPPCPSPSATLGSLDMAWLAVTQDPHYFSLWGVRLALTNTWPRRWQHGCGYWKRVQPWNHRSQSGTSEPPPCQQRTADPLLWGRWRSQPYPAAPLCPKRRGGRSREQKILYSLLYV